MKESVLEDIGLTKSEIKVYLALLELGSSSTGKIVEKSDTASSKVYEILDKLMEKGLVSFIIKTGVKYFEAAAPERLMDYMNEKERDVDRQKAELKSIIPELEIKRKLSKYKSEATIYRGMKGLETAFYSAISELKAAEAYYVIGIPSRSNAINRFFVKFSKYRARKKIGQIALFNEAARGEPQTLPENLNEFDKIKFIPQVTPAAINIIKDKVIIFPESTGEPLLFLIDSKEVAESFKVQFDHWWNQKVQTFEGQKAVENSMNSLIDNVKKEDEVMVFAAKPSEKNSADFNLSWNKNIRKKARNVRLLYYGDNEINRKRSKELAEAGCETKIYPTQQTLPVSTIVAGNNVLNLVWSKHPIAYQIDNKTVAESYKTNFELLWNQDVTISKGWDSFLEKSIDIIDELKKDESYDIIGAGYSSKELEEKFAKVYKKIHDKRIEKGIKTRLLFYQGNLPFIEKYKEEFYKGKKAEIKFLPYQTESPVEIIPHGNKTSLIIQEKEPTIITIDNEKITESFKEHFENLWNQDVKIYKGLDAVQEIFEDILESGHCDLIGARGYFVDERPKFIDGWEKRAEKRGLKWRNIVDPEVKGHRITKWKFAETKYTIQKEFSPLSVTWIFGNKVCISNWMEKEPIVVIIENKNLYKAYKQQFEVMWGQDTTTYKGFEGFKTFFDKLLEEKDIWWIGGNFGIKKYFPEYWKEYRKKRVEKKSFWHDLLDPKLMADDSLMKDQYYESRVLPKDLTSPHVIAIYGDTVANIIWAGEQTTIFEFFNKESANSYMNYFKHLWEKSERK
ncbi:MAG: helix-turn-helix domain-containing protein [Candidatus Woesearchaeota archaeon]